jgi:hypothetical protein
VLEASVNGASSVQSGLSAKLTMTSEEPVEANTVY